MSATQTQTAKEGAKAASFWSPRWSATPKAAPYLFILPFFVLFLPFGVGAIALAGAMAFVDWPIGEAPRFIGLANFARVIGDPVFHTGMVNTVRMLFAYMMTLIPLALFVAIALTQIGRRKANLVQLFIFAPITMSLVSVSVIFFLIYDENAGLLNAALRQLGLSSVPFLSDPHFAPWSIVAMRVWRVLGYYAIMLFAGLQSIPDDLYEAASIDGAGWWAKVRYVTLPMLKPVTLFVMVSASVSAWEIFAEPNILTGGGPARSTYTAVMYVFEMSFGRLNLGRGAAAAMILALAIVVTTFVLARAMKSRAHD